MKNCCVSLALETLIYKVVVAGPGIIHVILRSDTICFMIAGLRIGSLALGTPWEVAGSLKIGLVSSITTRRSICWLFIPVLWLRNVSMTSLEWYPWCVLCSLCYLTDDDQCDCVLPSSLQSLLTFSCLWIDLKISLLIFLSIPLHHVCLLLLLNNLNGDTSDSWCK